MMLTERRLLVVSVSMVVVNYVRAYRCVVRRLLRLFICSGSVVEKGVSIRERVVIFQRMIVMFVVERLVASAAVIRRNKSLSSFLYY